MFARQPRNDGVADNGPVAEEEVTIVNGWKNSKTDDAGMRVGRRVVRDREERQKGRDMAGTDGRSSASP